MFLFYTHLTDKTIYSMYFLRNKKRLFFSFKTTIPTCSLSSPSSPLSGIFARRPPSPCLSLFLILYYTVFHASTACVTRRSISIRAALHSFGNFRPAANTLVSRSLLRPEVSSLPFPPGKQNVWHAHKYSFPLHRCVPARRDVSPFSLCIFLSPITHHPPHRSKEAFL